MATVTLTVNPNVIDLKVGESATLNITTDTGNDLDVVPVDQSGVVDIVENNGSFTVTAVKAGTAELTVTAMDVDSDTAQATVTINVTEEVTTPDVEDKPTIATDRWTNAEMQTAIRANGDFEEKFTEIALNAPTDDRSLIAELSTFNKNTGVLQLTNNSPEYVSAAIFNIYKVMVDMLESAAVDNDTVKFENVLEIIQCYFVEYADDGFSYNALTRYLNIWRDKASKWNVVENDEHTHRVLTKIISALADPNTRDANKAVIDVDTLLDDETLLLSDELKERIKDYYA